MTITGILSILTAIQQLSGVVETWRQSAGLSKDELIAIARSKDAELADFIEQELAMLDRKAGGR